MPRKPRASIVGVAEHVIQRGNNRQSIFGCDGDMATYLKWLQTYSKRFQVSIHAWVLMSNHVHLLCTPRKEGAVSLMMQCLGRRYVPYFNRTYGRTGTLWEGRFRSSLVQDEIYLLELYRYIELNPVRAGIVTEPGEYRWSSYHANALGKTIGLLTPHELYCRLGKTAELCRLAYQKFCFQRIDDLQIAKIREATNKGVALGNANFIADAEQVTGHCLHENKRGRRTGWRKAVV